MKNKDEDKNKNEDLDRIRAVIDKEKESARARFGAAEFRARLVSKLGAQDEETPQPAPRRLSRTSHSHPRSARAFLRTRPLAAASLAAGLVALLAAIWLLVLAPSLHRPAATLPEHILEVLLQSSSQQQLATDPAAVSPGPRVFPAPRPVSDHEIPVIIFKVLESLTPARPPLEIPVVEEERASPTADKILFQEILKRIKEA